jgi:regulator of RNase E activity RraA
MASKPFKPFKPFKPVKRDIGQVRRSLVWSVVWSAVCGVVARPGDWMCADPDGLLDPP